MTNRWLVVSFAGVLAAFSAIAAFSAPSNAQAVVPSGLAALHQSANPFPPTHSLALGPLSSSTDLHVDVTLKLPDPSAVTSFIASLSDRHSANFHHFLRSGQFGQLFGPPLSEVAAVDAVLRSDGLHPGQVPSNRLSIPLTAPASVLDRAFHVSLMDYRLPNGRTAFTTLSPPSISASVAADIQGVIGLSDLIVAENSAIRSSVVRGGNPSGKLAAKQATAAPTPCAAATAAADSYGSYTADQLASYYGFDPLYSLGDFGQGVNVALVEFEPDLPSDIAAYQACYGTNATVNYIPVDGGVGSGTGTGEAALDIEDVIGLAPLSTIDVYSAAQGDVYDDYSAIVNADTDQVVSISWGSCELDDGIAAVQSENAVFDQAATQGQTVFAAAGDNGSTDCYGDKGTTNGSTPSVLDPAGQPYVIGVGGTSLVANSETVWNDSTDSGGAGGGGVSAAWCMPSYQDKSKIPGLISSYSESDPTDCGSTDSYMREVPDVSADADASTGYTVYYTGTKQLVTGWGPTGGTSAAAPLWAAAAALIDSSPFCADYGSGDAGVQPAGLYTIATWASTYYGLAFNDITTGNNDYTPSGYSGGLYPATVGYDMASGLGSPILAQTGNFYPGLAAQMCFEYGTDLDTTNITGISPNEGLSNESTSVTITGSGFLPIAGADELEVGTKWITVSCTTTTACTGTLPATEPGTDNLQMAVEDMTVSPVTVADEFTFGAPPPPTVTGITPTAGPAKGGTEVTIRGSNFVGTVSVSFGGTLATSVRALSSSEITATAPPRSGTIYVTVSTAGGSSERSAAARFAFVAAPTVTKVTPAVGPATGGTKVTIRGSNFVGAISVRFGGTLATGAHVLSSSEITATAPPRTGTIYVTVSAFGGSSKRTARYRYVAAPTVSKVTPAVGPAKGGTKVTIRGSNFVGTVLVRFGGTLAMGVRVLSSSEITATVPPGSGAVYVTVSAVGGNSRRTDADKFRY